MGYGCQNFSYKLSEMQKLVLAVTHIFESTEKEEKHVK